MVDVITTILISSPSKVVAEYAFNPDNAPEWYVNIKSIEWRTPKPLAVGSRISFCAVFLGKKLSYTYEVKELSERILKMHTAEGPFPMETTYHMDEAGAHITRMTLRNRGNPGGFATLLTPFISPMMRRANVKDLNRLKRILEGERDMAE
jgi:Polyketide cyclase / dehydrase and lipid transport